MTRIVDTHTPEYPLVEGLPFTEYNANEEFLFQIDMYFKDLFNFEIVSQKGESSQRKDYLLKGQFKGEAFSNHIFYVYVFILYEAGSGRSHDDELRTQLGSHNVWHPDLIDIKPATIFRNNSNINLDNKECYCIGIYKQDSSSHDVIFVGMPAEVLCKSETEQISPTSTFQTYGEYVREAYLKGMYLHNKRFTKSSTYNLLLFKPKYFLWYMKNRDSIHINDIDKANSIIEQIHQNSSLVRGNNVIKTDLKHSNYIKYLSAIKTKPFMLLAGISGTGKSRIVRKLAQATVTKELQGDDYAKMTPEVFETKRWDIHKPANFELIQVKPNWHNSMDVVGYLSNIPEPHYVFTPFIQFIVEAWKHTDIPYFLCLDEMNLAPVEEYFAEFLSAIESRSFENGEYITDPIIKPFKDFGEVKIKIDDYNNAPLTRTVKVHQEMINFLLSTADKDYENLKNKFNEKGLTLPPNLIVIGTVNMDETTFSFSRKVLDRAMSIEMNEVYYDRFLNDTTDDELKAIVKAFNDGNFTDESGSQISINKYLTERIVQAKDIIHNINKEDSEFVINYLTDINELLDGTPFKLGYRAANEALIYLYSSKLLGCTDNSEAMDKFTLMKILSRIEGDESKLRLTSMDIERLKNIGITFEDKDPNILSALRDIINKHLGSVHEMTEEKTDNEDTDSENKETSETNDTKTESVEEETVEESVETETTKTNNRKELKKWDSVKKAESMINALERDHFVSYWN